MTQSLKLAKKIEIFFTAPFSSSSGQTLIEALAAIAIAVVIVTSLVTLGIATQRAASTSKNQSQNTRYGEETLEVIRSIRDSKLSGSIINDTALTCGAACTFADLYSITIGGSGSAHYFTLSADATTGAPKKDVAACGGTDCYRLTWQTSANGTVAIGNTIYRRTIKVWDSGSTSDPNDPSNKVKTVDVIITWTDQGGPHTSETTTKLTNFK